jgi:hypothetical protein
MDRHLVLAARVLLAFPSRRNTRRGKETTMVKVKTPKKLGNVIFRRYRKLPDGTVLDAYEYGLKAWPMYLK